MAHIKNRLRGLLVAFVALVAALAIVPGVAQAEPWLTDGTPTGTGSIVLEFGEGERPTPADASTIKVYKVADIRLKADGTNVTEIAVNNQTEGDLYEAVVAWADSDTPTATEAKSVVDLVDKSTTFTGAAFNTEGNNVTISNLPAGVYYIEVVDSETYAYQSMIAAVEPARGEGNTWVIGEEANNTETIDVKCVTQGFDKEIVDATSGEDNVYNVGDEIDYQITFNVASNMAEFWIEDSLTGANVDANSVVLHIGEQTYKAGDLFTVNQVSETSFKFTLNADGIAEVLENGSSAYITYTATVNKDAALATGVTNIAKSSENGSDEAKQEFGGIKVYKYDSTDNAVLEGAVFGLYSDKACTDASKIAEATTGSDGLATFNVMLDLEKTYYVKEISAPAGYKLDDTVYEVQPVGTADVDYVLSPSSYTQIDVPNTPSDNNEGIDLPQTGGAGTVALTAAGVVIVAGAAAFIVRSRKEN